MLNHNLVSGPFVSVVIPCYKQSHYLKEAVDSVISQTYVNWEIIIVNDGSPDDTSFVANSLIKAHPDKKIRLIEKENGGLARARNLGISEAHGDYILPLDSDDKIHPVMLERMVKLLNADTSIAIAYVDQLHFGATNKEVRLHEYNFQKLCTSNLMAYCSLYRKAAWLAVGGYNPNMIWSYEDWDFWIACGARGFFAKRIPEVLFFYRVKEESKFTVAQSQYHDKLVSQIVLNHQQLYSPETLEWARKIGGTKETSFSSKLKKGDNAQSQSALSTEVTKLSNDSLRIVAILSAYNEADVIYHVIEDFIRNGVEVYLLDNNSTDRTVEVASKWLGNGLIKIEKFPQDSGYSEKCAKEYVWNLILKRKEELAFEINADWFIHSDADEFREGPWPGKTLSQAIRDVDDLGYNAINFALYNFRPIDDKFVEGSDVREHLLFFEQGAWFDALQIKAWKKTGERVDLASSGGHSVSFTDRKIFPVPFILRHYPIRSESHGRRKVFAERLPRFTKEEREAGWHVQYNGFVKGDAKFLYDPAKLVRYDSSSVRAELLARSNMDLLVASSLSLGNKKFGEMEVDPVAVCSWLGRKLGQDESFSFEVYKKGAQILEAILPTQSCGERSIPFKLENSALKLLLVLTELKSAFARISGDSKMAHCSNSLKRVLEESLNKIRPPQNDSFQSAFIPEQIFNKVSPPKITRFSKNGPTPFWSIMIPAYNPNPEYLNKVLRSVLTALPKGVDAQIEILDDASPNCDVAALLKKMTGMTKVSVHRNMNNLGYIANWNACIERARGEWVHILHQDDYVLPGFYEKISAGLKLHPEAGAAFCRHNHVSAKNETTFTSALERAEPGILENWPERLSSMQRMQFVSTVVRRSTFEKVGGFWSEVRSAADWEMWMRIASAVPVFFHPEVLACFRIHNISESSRLLMSGENSTDTCRAIDLFSQYLPEDKRAQLVAVAKNHYARSAFGLALSFLQQKQFAAASAQVNAALELEPTVQNEQIAQEIRNQIPAAVLNESTADASNAVQTQSLVNFFDQEEVDNIQHLVTAFQADPVDDSSQKPLRDLRKGLADYLLGVQPSDLKSLMGGSYGKVFELILNSGLQDEALTSEESNFADSLVGGFDGEGQFDVRRLMASMLFWRAHRTAALLAVELIPSWFFESYINYLVFSPEAFQEIGETELYSNHIHNVISEFWRRIEESPRSPLSLKLSQIVASRLNLIPLYFNEQGNKDTYILRSKFIGHFLESRGLKLAETGQKASSARKRIKVGFLNAHFTSQTETYTTIPTFSHLDRSKFEVILYCLGASGGPLENFCRNCADSFVVLPQALDEQIKKIRGDKLDALVIGTNVTAVTNQAALLASARLAPVQLINNSSPVTSGMPHLDGYLSGTFLVDEKSGEEYSEKLCLLDGPSHCFNYEVDRREPVVKLDRAGLGIPQDAVVYFSGANCFKIIPEMQEAWARILAKVPGSVLLLHPFNPNWASKYPVLRFERNMLAAFARHGVEANRLVLSRERLPSRSDVLELIKLSDIYLDSFPFAGVNSAVDPLEVGIPLVACEMQTFRSRMAGSLLRELKIEELIATGEQDYIDLATKLGLDSSYRAEVSQKIVSAMSQNPRFLDSAAYSANMGRIIESLVGRSLPEAMPKNGDLTIQDAQTAFSEGRLSDAEDICREILGKDERCAGAWHLMGKLAALQGDLETAGEFATVACELDTQNSEFVRELAEVFLRKKELEPAEQQIRHALEMLPDSPEGLVLLGRILAERDDKSASLEAFQDALRLRKDYAEGFSQYATALQKFGRVKDAISQIRKACALEPDSVEFQTNLAISLEQNARYVDALAAYGKASRMNPNVGFVWFRQGKLLNGLKRYAEALPVLEKAISLPGQLGDYHYEYGLALHMSKRFQEALVHYEKALSMGYETAALHCNRGVIYKDLRKGGDSIMAFHKAVTMDPSNVSYLNNLGAAALELGLNSEALDCFEQAVEKNPKLPTARNNIGNLLKDRARGMDALPQYRKSMELNPDDRDAPSNYLLCHMYIPDMDPKVVFEEHKKWGISTSKKFPSTFKFKPRAAGAKIRVGFLSADLCHHPVAHFIEPIFRGYDRERFEFVAYGDQRKSDEFSARFAKQVDLWRETSSYDDRALAKLIHEDRVDILFELAGHTAYNRLGVFALKPAPVQVSYLGYPGTTGLPTIDFRITDAFADPQGTTEHLHTEKLIRVPECAWCFEPDVAAPEVEPLPALKNGFVTFGCFNNMAKLNPALFEAWAEILLRVPGSHLRLKARTLTDDGVRKELKSYFTERGIEEDRLDFFGHTKKIADHLNHYHSVDIALDSFPYHGTTTTCEAMWMGCPVVTRAGKTHVSRVGVSLLSAVGLQEFITDTREAYIEKAVALAGQTDRLQELRTGMRERMRQSVLMDEKRFVRGFEKALMEMATLGGLMRS